MKPTIDMFVGWIDRDGNKYRADNGTHCEVAYDILEKQGYSFSYTITDDPEDMLLERGWVKTFYTLFCHKVYHVYYNCYYAPTKIQKDLILEMISTYNPEMNEELRSYLSQ